MTRPYPASRVYNFYTPLYCKMILFVYTPMYHPRPSIQRKILMSRSVSRRRFLEDSLLGITAAAGAAYSVTSSTAAAQSTAANDKIGVAVIGCGGQGRQHIRRYRDDNRCAVLYLVDPDPRTLTDTLIDDIAAMQGGIKPKRVADIRTALDDNAVDAVSSATTNHWHALSGLWAVQAGKHAYVEKPGSHNVHEGWALAAAAKKYNRVVQIGIQGRTYKNVADLANFIHDGGIGEVKLVRGLCYKQRRAIGPKGEYLVPEGVDYDLWSGPAPIMPLTRPRFDYDWHWQRLYGNGDLGNQGSHQTDIARWFLGVKTCPQAVISYGGRLGYNIEKNDPDYVDAGDVANTLVSIYDYGDKCMVFETRGLSTENLRIPTGLRAGTRVGVIAYGTKGFGIQGVTEGGQTYSNSAAYDLEGNLIQEFTGGGNHFGNFLDAVIANDPSAVTLDAYGGALSAVVSHFGNISYYLGEENRVSIPELKSALKAIKSLDDDDATVDRTVEHLTANRVDLERTPMSVGPMLQYDSTANVFVGNDAANEMLTRDYREPYIVPKPENV